MQEREARSNVTRSAHHFFNSTHLCHQLVNNNDVLVMTAICLESHSTAYLLLGLLYLKLLPRVHYNRVIYNKNISGSNLGIYKNVCTTVNLGIYKDFVP